MLDHIPGPCGPAKLTQETETITLDLNVILQLHNFKKICIYIYMYWDPVLGKECLEFDT